MTRTLWRFEDRKTSVVFVTKKGHDCTQTVQPVWHNSEVLHSEIRQKDSARGSEAENAREDSACLFGKSSLCRNYFSDEFSVEER